MTDRPRELCLVVPAQGGPRVILTTHHAGSDKPSFAVIVGTHRDSSILAFDAAHAAAAYARLMGRWLYDVADWLDEHQRAEDKKP